MASALYEPDWLKEEAKKKAAAQQQAATQPFKQAAASSPASRQPYYQDLQRQYESLQKTQEGLDPGGFGNWISGGNSRIKGTKAEIDSQMSAIQSLLTKSGAAFNALDSQAGPQLTPQMLARLQALDQEAKATSLAEDPLFQGDRSMLVQGGQQALSGVANKRLGYGTSGGFSNQGSISDIYDRLGTQLSQLGQQSRQVKEQKRDVVAESYQAFDDAQREFENNQKKAEAAIISGNIDQAYEFMQKATQAEVRMREAQAGFTQALTGNLIKGAITGTAYAFGGPAAAGATGAAAGSDAFMKAGLEKSMPPQIVPIDLAADVPVSRLRGGR